MSFGESRQAEPDLPHLLMGFIVVWFSQSHQKCFDIFRLTRSDAQLGQKIVHYCGSAAPGLVERGRHSWHIRNGLPELNQAVRARFDRRSILMHPGKGFFYVIRVFV